MNEESPLLDRNSSIASSQTSYLVAAKMTMEAANADAMDNGQSESDVVEIGNQQHNALSLESFADSDSDSDNGETSQPLGSAGSPALESSNNHPPHNKLGTWSMAILVFYSVSGGPFGIEETVRTGGNCFALIGFLVLPWVWSLQEALMTTELGTTFPEASGGVVWSEAAFGPLAGWMAGYLSWIGGATDNAIYPVLFLDYLLQVVGNNNNNDGSDDTDIMSPVLRFCLVTSTTLGLAYVNWRGLDLVGKLSVLICVLAMSPFVILVVVGSFKVDPSRWWELPPPRQQGNNTSIDIGDESIGGGLVSNFAAGGVLWRPFLNNLFWNLNSFDSAGCLVAELEANASFLRAMMLGLVLVVVCYFFPLLIAIGSSDSDPSDWTDGYLATVNAQVVGPWLGAWTVFAAGISNIGLFQAELSSDAFQLMGMADRGYLPKVFSQRSQHGTPTYGLVLGTAVIVAMASLRDLDALIEMLNFNYGIALLIEYASFFKLRISRPDLERPYKIPLGTVGCSFLFLPTVATTIFVLSLATYETYYFSLASWITGYLLYATRKWSEREHYERVEENDSDNDNDNEDTGDDIDDDSFQDEHVETLVDSEGVTENS